MDLSSTAFKDGGDISQKYGKKISNISPPLSWRGWPKGTKSFALSMVDKHPIAKGYVHWLVADIDEHTAALPEGASTDGRMPGGARELKPYAGPFPPSGTHDYELTIYALSVETLDLSGKVTLEAFTRVVQQSCLSSARLTGKFTKMK